MKTSFKLAGMGVLAVALIVFFTYGMAMAWTEVEVPSEDNAMPEMVVEAENEVEQEISRTIIDFNFDAALIDTFYTDMDEEVLTHSPVKGLLPFLNNPDQLQSDQTPHCWLPDPASVPVAWFYPENPEGHKVQSWTLAVTNYRGSVFRHFQGKKEIPEKLPWDGRDDRGMMLQVGYPYSYVFSIMDKGTNTYNYAGKSFRLPALDYMEGTERRLDFSGDKVFFRDGPKLQESGRGWLTMATDQIRKDHPHSPLRVLVLAETQKLAEARAKVVSDFLIESMILPGDWIETEAQAKPDLRSEMDGLVSIRVEHAQ